VWLTEVSKEYLLGYYRHLEDQVHSGKLARGTFRLHIQAVRRWFTYLYVQHHIYSDPSTTIPVVKGREKAAHRIVTETEARAFIVSVIKHSLNPLQDLALFSVLSGLGLRPSEAANLTVGDVDREAALLRVLGKGNKERAVPLPGPVLLALERHMAARGHVPDDAPLWIGVRGGQLTYEQLRVRFHHFRRLSGIDRNVGGPHVFRHYFITQNLLNGVDLEDLAAIVGHDNIRALQPYFHTTPEGMRAAILRAYGEVEQAS
jgi:site-specific recombinase XerD